MEWKVTSTGATTGPPRRPQFTEILSLWVFRALRVAVPRPAIRARLMSGLGNSCGDFIRYRGRENMGMKHGRKAAGKKLARPIIGAGRAWTKSGDLCSWEPGRPLPIFMAAVGQGTTLLGIWCFVLGGGLADDGGTFRRFDMIFGIMICPLTRIWLVLATTATGSMPWHK